jgi:hypothetical protein
MTEMRLQDFLYRDFFVGITDAKFAVALEMVKTRFHGVASLWEICDEETKAAKRRLCYSNLLAWQLMSLYPDSAQGVSGMGSLPLDMKAIHDIKIKYRDLIRQDTHGILDSLITNYFGQQALLELQSAPEMYMLVPGSMDSMRITRFFNWGP